MNGFFAGTGACKYASKRLKADAAAQPNGCSVCLVPAVSGKSIQILNVVQIQGFKCKFWGYILIIECF
jgi:hypothetical protein